MSILLSLGVGFGIGALIGYLSPKKYVENFNASRFEQVVHRRSGQTGVLGCAEEYGLR